MSSPSSVVWVDGAVFVDDELPDDVASLLGTELGLSPVVYVHADELLHAHVRMLSLAADTLGYGGFEAAVVRSRLATATVGLAAGDVARISLVPDASSHRAMPPGAAWSIRVETVTPSPPGADPSDGLRLRVGAHRRNQTSPATSIVLHDDAELRAGAVHAPGTDLTLWGNLSGRAACADQHSLFARVAGQLVTPPLADGAPRTAWRHALLTGPDVAEAPLPLDGLVEAVEALVCLSPWGAARPVRSVDDDPVDGAATAALLDELHERMEDLRR